MIHALLWSLLLCTEFFFYTYIMPALKKIIIIKKSRMHFVEINLFTLPAVNLKLGNSVLIYEISQQLQNSSVCLKGVNYKSPSSTHREDMKEACVDCFLSRRAQPFDSPDPHLTARPPISLTGDESIFFFVITNTLFTQFSWALDIKAVSLQDTQHSK